MCKVFSYHAKAEFYLADGIAIFVSIVKSCYYPRMGCSRISLAGSPSTAVRFSSRLAIPYSHDLTG